MSAPTPVLRGLASIHGVVGTFDVLVYPLQQKLQMTQNFEEEAVKDANGFTAALLARDEHGMLNIGVKFTADTAAHAATPTTGTSTMGQPFLLPYQTVTLSGFALAAINNTFQNVTGTSLDMENSKVADGDYKLRLWANSTQNTSLTTAPS